MNKNAYADNFAEAAQALFESLDVEQQIRAKLIGKMQSAYIGSPRDTELDHAFNGLIENAAAAIFGKAGKRRALFVVGEAGSGKTTAVERHISKRRQFAPRKAADGEMVEPMVWFEAPKPLTLKGLARSGLAALDYEVLDKKLTEQELFDLWKQQIRENRVLFLWIDEMQHVLKGNTTKEIHNVADVIKSLVQIDGWPLHLILSGVPALAQFLHQSGGTDRQLSERSMVIEFRRLTTADVKKMQKILQRVIVDNAGLAFGDDLNGVTEEDPVPGQAFVKRLIHASNFAFGSSIQLIRSTCEYVLRSGQTEVTLASFASAYGLATGCRKEQNIFIVDDWKVIEPNNALAELLSQLAAREAKSTPTRVAARVAKSNRAKTKVK
jgi:GTPase SAR1 family protein